MNLTWRMEPQAGVVAHVVDGEAVLVQPDRRMVSVLNPVAARIWELADGRRTLAEIAALICEEFMVEPAQAQADVLEFAGLLQSKGLVKLCE